MSGVIHTLQNGLQDACEDPIDGLVVQLYSYSGMLVGEDVTANGGLYYFDETNVDTTGISNGNPNTAWSGLEYNSKYYLVYGDGQYNSGTFTIGANSHNVTPTSDANSNGNDNIDSDISATSLTSGSIGSIPNGLPFICINSDAVGCGNHSYDLGLTCCSSPDCYGIQINRN